VTQNFRLGHDRRRPSYNLHLLYTVITGYCYVVRASRSQKIGGARGPSPWVANPKVKRPPTCYHARIWSFKVKRTSVRTEMHRKCDGQPHVHTYIRSDLANAGESTGMPMYQVPVG